MTDIMNLMVRLTAGLSISLVIFTASFIPSFGAAEQLTSAHQKKIESILSAVRGPSALDQALRLVDFPPKNEAFSGETWKDFKTWPDVRKLEAAFHAANLGNAGDGEILLKDVMVLTARKNPAIISDTAFKTHIMADPAYVPQPEAFKVSDLKKIKPKTFVFTLPSPAQLTAPLPAEYQRIVQVISENASSHGRAVRLARLCCDIDPKDVYNRMRAAKSNKSVLEWALTKSPPPPTLDSKVNKIVEAAVSRNPALAYDKAITSFVEEQRNLGVKQSLPSTPESNVPVGRNFTAAQSAANLSAGTPDELVGNVLSEIGSEALPKTAQALSQSVSSVSSSTSHVARAGAQMAARQFASFEYRSYGALPDNAIAKTITSSSRTKLAFKVASMRAGGFGGVFLGAEVTGNSDLLQPVWFEYRPIDDAVIETHKLDKSFKWGYLEVHYADGSIGVTRPMRAQDVWAAVSIVYTGIEGIISPLDVGDGTGGSGIGLAGFTGRRSTKSFDGELVSEATTPALTFVVHPSVVGFALGEDALLVDALLINKAPPNLMKQLKVAVSTHLKNRVDDNKNTDMAMFQNWLNDKIGSTYKFVDVPMQIGRTAGGIVHAVRSDSKAKNWPEPLRRQAFLRFQKFGNEGRPNPEETPPFYPIVPMLIDTWPSFAHLNDFAEVLAIVRWLRINDADWQKGLEEPPRGPSLTTLITTADEKGMLAPSIYESNLALAEEVRIAARAISYFAPKRALQLNAEIHAVRIERLAAREALDLWGLEAIGQGSDFQTYQSARRELQFFEGLIDLPINMMRITLLQEGVDVSGFSDASLRTQVRNQIRDIRKASTKAKAKIMQTPEGKFVDHLEQIERRAADKSPLAKGKSSIRAGLIGPLPDSQLAKYHEILTKRSAVEKLREDKSTIVTQFESLDVSPESPKFSEVIELLGTDQQRSDAIELKSLIDALNAEMESPDTGVFRWISAWFERRTPTDTYAQLIRGFGYDETRSKIKNLKSEISDLEERIDDLQRDAEVERKLASDRMPLPGFDEWYALQQSFRDVVFSN